MAATGTPTPNLGLRIPIGTDPASVDDINYNSNLLDTKLGAVGSDSVQDQIDTLNSTLTWKLLADKADTSDIAYPSDWNELWVIATASDSYGWSTVSMIIPKEFTTGQYVTAVGRSNIVLVVYKGANGISIETNASQNVARWKAYYR